MNKHLTPMSDHFGAFKSAHALKELRERQRRFKRIWDRYRRVVGIPRGKWRASARKVLLWHYLLSPTHSRSDD